MSKFSSPSLLINPTHHEKGEKGLIEEAGLIVTYVTMGLTPIVYNLFAAKRAVKKRATSREGEEEANVEEVPREEVRSFTLTVPCSVTFLHAPHGEGHAIHLSVKSVHPLPVAHVKRILHQG